MCSDVLSRQEDLDNFSGCYLWIRMLAISVVVEWVSWGYGGRQLPAFQRTVPSSSLTSMSMVSGVSSFTSGFSRWTNVGGCDRTFCDCLVRGSLVRNSSKMALVRSDIAALLSLYWLTVISGMRSKVSLISIKSSIRAEMAACNLCNSMDGMLDSIELWYFPLMLSPVVHSL